MGRLDAVVGTLVPATTQHTLGGMLLSMHTIIIGGVAGGMSAATRLRRLDESADIIVLERSGYVSFANCGLPYHVGGVIEDRSALLLQTPESLAARFNLDVRVHTEVLAIDRDRKVVTVRTLDPSAPTDKAESPSDTYELAYDNLILSPGARPVRPPLPGIERALSLRDIEDTDALVAAIEGQRTAAVIGGGFIGLEMAENLVHRGLQVSLIEALPQVLAPLDPEMVAPVQQALRDHRTPDRHPQRWHRAPRRRRRRSHRRAP